MADEPSVVPIWIDVGKNLNAASLVVCLQHITKEAIISGGKFDNFFRIYRRKLTSDDRKENQRSKNVVYYPGSIVVSPRSFSGLSTCSGNEMQMRLQFEYTRDHKENGSKKCLEQEMQELRKKRHCICCRLCGSAIQSPERKFKRVLELPSENWLELAQDWCCHGSSNLTSMAGALEPDENDCFVGDYYIKVNCSSAVPDSLQIIPGEELLSLKCSRCNAIVGNVCTEDRSRDSLELMSDNSIHLHKHKISTRHSNLFRSYCIETFITSYLISKSRGAVNFRFLVQDPIQNGKRTTYACLWLFNADSAVVTNIEPHDIDSISRGVKNGLYLVKSKARYLPVLKILYKIKPFFDDINWDLEVIAWQENSSVQPLLFTKETCLHLILLLIQSTNTIAPSLREVNGFKVGFLRTSNV